MAKNSGIRWRSGMTPSSTRWWKYNPHTGKWTPTTALINKRRIEKKNSEVEPRSVLRNRGLEIVKVIKRGIINTDCASRNPEQTSTHEQYTEAKSKKQAHEVTRIRKKLKNTPCYLDDEMRCMQGMDYIDDYPGKDSVAIPCSITLNEF